MDEFNISREIYSKIILAISDRNTKQKKVAEMIDMTPQTFSDNMNKLKNGHFVSLSLLIKLQEVLEIDLGINFFWLFYTF